MKKRKTLAELLNSRFGSMTIIQAHSGYRIYYEHYNRPPKMRWWDYRLYNEYGYNIYTENFQD